MRLWCGRNRDTFAAGGGGNKRSEKAKLKNAAKMAAFPVNVELREELRLRISPDNRREEPRSGRYAGCGFAAPPQMLRRKTRLMEGEARDEGASAELSDMQRRGSSDAR